MFTSTPAWNVFGEHKAKLDKVNSANSNLSGVDGETFWRWRFSGKASVRGLWWKIYCGKSFVGNVWWKIFNRKMYWWKICVEKLSVGDFQRKSFRRTFVGNICWEIFDKKCLGGRLSEEICWLESYNLLSLYSPLFKIMAYVGSFMHFVFVFLCIFVFLIQWIVESHKLSEYIWFVWLETS